MKEFASEMVIMELQNIHEELHELNANLSRIGIDTNTHCDDRGIPGISVNFVDNLKKITPKSD